MLPVVPLGRKGALPLDDALSTQSVSFVVFESSFTGSPPASENVILAPSVFSHTKPDSYHRTSQLLGQHGCTKALLLTYKSRNLRACNLPGPTAF
jgi:hypothetical protein